MEDLTSVNSSPALSLRTNRPRQSALSKKRLLLLVSLCSLITCVLISTGTKSTHASYRLTPAQASYGAQRKAGPFAEAFGWRAEDRDSLNSTIPYVIGASDLQEPQLASGSKSSSKPTRGGVKTEATRLSEQNGQIIGAVLDPRGAAIVIPKPTILVRSVTGSVTRILPDENGNYQTKLPVGIYQVTAEVANWYPFRRAAFRVGANSISMINIVPALEYSVRGTTVSTKKSIDRRLPPPKYDSISVPQSSSEFLDLLIQFDKKRSVNGKTEYYGAVLSYDLLTIYADRISLNNKTLRARASGERVIVEDGKQSYRVRDAEVNFKAGEPILELIDIAGGDRNQERNAASPVSQVVPTVSSREKKKPTDSSVGLGLTFVTPDRNGGVWLSGTAFQFRGLLVNDAGPASRAVTIKGTWTAAEPQFVSRNIGWMTNYHFLYRTIDGGNSWSRIKLAGEPSVRSLFFSDVQNGWIGGVHGEIYRTTDGGQTWKKHLTGLDYEIHQLFFVDMLHGWASAYISSPDLRRMSALLKTNDGGETWEVLSNVDTDSAKTISLQRITFVSPNEGWGIDARLYNIVHTINGGKTWTIQQEREDHGWNSLVFLNSKEGWAAGRDGIIHTTDGGETWESQLDGKSPAMADCGDQIVFTDSRHGWVVCSLGALRTINGGATWDAISSDWKRTIPTFDELLEENSSARMKRQ